MISLTAGDWYSPAGRNKIATFPAGSLPEDMRHPDEFMNTVVLIDNVPYLVTGVESFRLFTGESRYTLGFGLGVRTPTEADIEKWKGFEMPEDKLDVIQKLLDGYNDPKTRGQSGKDAKLRADIQAVLNS